MSLSSVFQPLPAYKTSSLARSLMSGYGPDGGTQPPATAPASPPSTGGVLTPIRSPIDSAEGISYMPGQRGQPYTGAGSNASGPAAPPKPSTVPGSNIGSGGGYNFNFEDDPILARIRALNQQQIANAESAALASRKQAEIGYGYDPNIKYEDEGTQEAAKQNAFSTLAQLLFGHEERGRSLDESLNKSNLFYSGERGRQLGLEGRQYTGEQSQANQGLQGQLQQIAQMVLDTRNQAQEREMQGAESAYERSLQMMLASGGYGGGGGFGGGNGGLENPDQFGVPGYSGEDLQSAAAQYAQGRSYGGSAYVPGMVMQEGHVEVRDGVPGVYIKYRTPGYGDSTEWTPLGGG